MAGKDYYSILGIGRNATEKDIKQAYRRLARKYHPDVNPGDKASEEKFKEINEAHEVLSNPENRRKYDQFGDQWRYADQFAQAGGQRGPSRGFGQGETVFHFDEDSGTGSVFEDLLREFGGRTGRRGVSARRGPDIEHPVEVTLEEAYHGTSRILSLEGEEACPTCGGTGRIQRAMCVACRGSGAAARNKRLEVKIPSGVRNGSRVRIAGQGGPGLGGGSNGDLYLLVSVKPHPLFERRDDDLYVDVPVPLVVAVLGGEVEVPTLKGKVALKIPPETQNGRIFRLSKQGMPRLGSSSYGDLLAKVSVQLPVNLSAEERKLFEQLKQMRHG